MRFDKVTGEPKAPFWMTLVFAIMLWLLGTIPFIIIYQIIGGSQ